MNTKFFALAAFALSLVACTNDDEAMDNSPVAARINAEISNAVATRASGTTWNENDRIGLTGIGTQYDRMKTTASVLPASAPSMTTCPTS